MPRRFFGWLSAIIAVLIVASLAGWFLAQRLPAKPSATLPNGIRITVEGVTFGTNHNFTTSPKINAILRKLLPVTLNRLIPAAHTLHRQTDKPEAFVYLSAVNPATGAAVNQTWDKFRIIDEHGCIWPVDLASAPVQLRAFPRRGPSFKLHATAAGGAAVDLIIPNPVKGPFPRWTAEPLPARRSAEGLTFELSRIEAYEAQFGNDGIRHFFTPVFHVFRDDMPVTDEWRPVTEFLDETGNRSTVLCPYEPVWKVEAKFYRTGKATFPEDQIWRISGVQVPESGRSLALKDARKFGNMKVQLLALAGPGQFQFSNGVEVARAGWKDVMAELSSGRAYGGTRILTDFTRKESTLLIGFTRPPNSDEILVRQRDQNGRWRDVVPYQSGGVATNYIVSFKLPQQNNSTNIDLEIILQQPVLVEFTVQPPKPARLTR